MTAAVIILVGSFIGCSDDPAGQDNGIAPDSGPGKDGKAGDGPGKDGKSSDGKPGDSVKPGDQKAAKDKGPSNVWTVVQGATLKAEDHTSTVLPNGDILIVGGFSDYSTAPKYEDRAWRYQVASGKMVSAGKMSTPRSEHIAVALASGKVLVVGGRNKNDYLATSDIFDPKTQKWTAGPKMFTSRWGHAGVRLKNGWVLVTGGFTSSDSTASIALYDPGSNSFKTPASAMKEKRRSHTMTLLNNGKVLVAAGLNGSKWQNYDWLRTTEMYDPKAGSFTKGPDLSKGRTGHTATLRKDGTVLITGGYCGNSKCTGKNLNDLYNPVKNTMTGIAHAGVLPSTHAAVLLNDGRVLVVGDLISRDPKKVVAFSPKMGGIWDSLAKMPQAKAGPTASLLKDGSVLVMGGTSASSPYTYSEKILIYHP